MKKRNQKKSTVVNTAVKTVNSETSSAEKEVKVVAPKPLLKPLSDIFTLKISMRLLEKIEYLCDRFPSVEWSGTLYYTIAGDMDTEDLTLTAIDLYLQDIGSSAYTEYEFNEEYAGFLASRPELRAADVFEGHIHSHNKMAAFFSGTDDAELIDSAILRKNFLSLIVNNEGKYVAALGTKAEAFITQNTVYTYQNFEGKSITVESPATKTIPMIFKRMAVIEKERPEFTLRGMFSNIIDKIQQSKAKPKTHTTYDRSFNNYGSMTPSNTYVGRLDFDNPNPGLGFQNYLSSYESKKFGLEKPVVSSVLPYEKEANLLLSQSLACSPLFKGSPFEAIQKIPSGIAINDYKDVASTYFDNILDRILDSLEYNDVLEQQQAMDRICESALQLIEEQATLRYNPYVKIIKQFLEDAILIPDNDLPPAEIIPSIE